MMIPKVITEAFNQPEIIQKIDRLCVDNLDVESLAAECTNVYNNVARKSLKVVSPGKCKRRYKQVWFDRLF